MKIEYDGKLIHVANAEELEEALIVIENREKKRKESEKKSVDLEPIPDEEGIRVGRLFRSVNPNARKFMMYLLAFPNGVEGGKFAEDSKFAVEKFGGIMGGIQKLAEGQKLKRDQFVVSAQRSLGTARFRWLAPGKLLLKYQFDLRKAAKEDGGTEQISMGA
jgi:hypothetical protein